MQDPPELIKDMIKLWQEGHDVIYAVRKKRDGEPILKLMATKTFYKLMYGLTDAKIPKDTGDFRLADRKVVDIINSLPEHNKYLRGLFSWVGFKQEPIEYERKEKISGKSKYSLKKLKKLAYDGIFSFSYKPLKIMGSIGGILIILSIILLLISVVLYKTNNIFGWSLIIICMAFSQEYNL